MTYACRIVHRSVHSMCAQGTQCIIVLCYSSVPADMYRWKNHSVRYLPWFFLETCAQGSTSQESSMKRTSPVYPPDSGAPKRSEVLESQWVLMLWGLYMNLIEEPRIDSECFHWEGKKITSFRIKINYHRYLSEQQLTRNENVSI